MTAFWGYAWRWCNEVFQFLAGPGISGYSQTTEKAGPSLVQCLRQAEGVIPLKQHQETPVYLGATAGMRLLRYHSAHLLPLHLRPPQTPSGVCAVKSLEMLPAGALPRPPSLWTPDLPRLFPHLPVRSVSTCFPLPSSPAPTCNTDTRKDSRAQTGTWRSCSNICHSLVIDVTHSFCALSCFNSPHTSTWPETTKAKVTI